MECWSVSSASFPPLSMLLPTWLFLMIIFPLIISMGWNCSKYKVNETLNQYIWSISFLLFSFVVYLFRRFNVYLFPYLSFLLCFFISWMFWTCYMLTLLLHYCLHLLSNVWKWNEVLFLFFTHYTSFPSINTRQMALI